MKTIILKWNASEGERALMQQIAKRALKETLIQGSRQDLLMELEATHSNGNPMDFQALLKAPAFDFAHDIYGIRNHLNRKTGKLEHCFVPRFSKPSA